MELKRVQFSIPLLSLLFKLVACNVVGIKETYPI
jgi:hypothetical protein